MDPGDPPLGASWMPNISGWPNSARVCSLSQVLETDPIPPKYFLSALACKGILRRAAKRGRELPTMLRRALELKNIGDGGNIGYRDAGVASITLNTQGNIGVATVAFTERGREQGCTLESQDELAYAILEGAPHSRQIMAQMPVVFWNGDPTPKHCEGVALTMRRDQGGEGYGVATSMQVRRLTPRECCRLQGFPDDYTAIQVPASRRAQKNAHGKALRMKPAADGPRYRALGNSFAVPCMAWIGGRIQSCQKTS